MNESERLADQIERAVNGEAWHGPAWCDVLKGVGRDAALQRPVSDAHSIAEIVLHVTTWHDIVRRRLLGEILGEVSDEQDWPKAAFANDQEWQDAVARLFETGRALSKAVAAFPPEQLHENRSNVAQTWYVLLIGILQHDLYHAGQVGLLRKAAVAVTA
jgi:uncharacterized damage-inducible protein DinB